MNGILSDAEIAGFERLARRAPNMRLLLASHEALRVLVQERGFDACLESDAALGREVRKLPVGGALRRAEGMWVGTFFTSDGYARHTEETPEAAIKAIMEAART